MSRYFQPFFFVRSLKNFQCSLSCWMLFCVARRGFYSITEHSETERARLPLKPYSLFSSARSQKMGDGTISSCWICDQLFLPTSCSVEFCSERAQLAEVSVFWWGRWRRSTGEGGCVLNTNETWRIQSMPQRDLNSRYPTDKNTCSPLLITFQITHI